MQDNTIKTLYNVAKTYLIKLFKDKHLFLYVI